MNKYKAMDPLTQKILDLTLEIIFLLTGEDHMVVKIHEMVTDHHSHHRISEGGYCRSQSFNMEHPPHTGIHEQNHEKILELTNKITQLLTGEVPIRCEDVTVYLSMEEWEYLEGHRDLYKDVTMENHRLIVTHDKAASGECHTPVSFSDYEFKNITNNMEQYLNKETDRETNSATNTEQETCEKINVPEKDLNPVAEHTEYPSTDIKKESPTYEEDNMTDAETSKLAECTQTEWSPDTFGEELKGYSSLMKINPRESLNESQKPDQSIYYTDTVTLNSVQKGNPTLSSQMSKFSYSDTDLLIHGTNCKEEQPFSSSACGDNSAHEFAFKHQHIYTDGQPFSCPECGEKVTDLIALKKHQTIHTGKTQFKHPESEESFTARSHLAAHTMIQTGEKPFKCAECGKCFSRASQLAAHTMIHTGEKPFKCTECGKCFTYASNLSEHKRIHTGEKPFKCPECGKCFTQAPHLTKHKRIHTGEKPFKCSECGKCFTQASHLKKHKKIHTVDKPFTCSECGKCSTQASSHGKHK
uniref:Uncharacterized protein n=1 Tax=Leptobrachium leishanense TaxID=445787 RepID=A0A8C5Q6M7_9ANUR